ncbi:Tn3 family transposase [Streptomyces sp. NPDC097981]|uniref:Tn3 family transposase n=1 Tax=Streptomyces sp. NPDC097981 TaxID=3155428 RepID=UPI0033318C87
MQYTDTHGASIVGFAFAHMLDFKLMPRLKDIGSARLYRPTAGEDDNWPNLAPVLSTKTINWDLIRQQYDQIVNTPPPCAWAPPRPNRSCAASPAAARITPPTRREEFGRAVRTSSWLRRHAGGTSPSWRAGDVRAA